MAPDAPTVSPPSPRNRAMIGTVCDGALPRPFDGAFSQAYAGSPVGDETRVHCAGGTTPTIALAGAGTLPHRVLRGEPRSTDFLSSDVVFPSKRLEGIWSF